MQTYMYLEVTFLALISFREKKNTFSGDVPTRALFNLFSTEISKRHSLLNNETEIK